MIVAEACGARMKNALHFRKRLKLPECFFAETEIIPDQVSWGYAFRFVCRMGRQTSLLIKSAVLDPPVATIPLG